MKRVLSILILLIGLAVSVSAKDYVAPTRQSVEYTDSTTTDTYTINKGDTLYAISKKYNINPNLLASINGLNLDDYIYQNQVLLLPVSGYSYYVTAEGDTLDTVSQMFKKNKENILKENETIYLLPGQILVSERK